MYLFHTTQGGFEASRVTRAVTQLAYKAKFRSFEKLNVSKTIAPTPTLDLDSFGSKPSV